MKKVTKLILIFFMSFFFMVNVKAQNNLLFLTDADQYNNYTNEIVSCGEGLMDEIPSALPKVVSIIYSTVQVLVPILLIIFGSLDLVKGISAQKEDEIKKGQQMFIKRMIAAVIVFFVFVLVKLVISLVADNDSKRTAVKIMDCAECFIKNDCSNGG